MIKNRLTELFGIKYPIIQGALGNVSESPKFVAAVCNAGALGILAAVGMSAEGMREAMREIRQLTDGPFGVNTLPANPEYDKQVQVMIEEKAPVFAHGRYNPVKLINAAKGCNCVSAPTVGAVKHAVYAERDGADALLLTGMEAGGHTGYVGTMVILPAVVNAVDIPVVVGGGIAQPEQFAAALCMGAEGVMMGTRFMLTKESPLPPSVIKRFLKANEEETYATVHVSGRNQRWLVTPFLEKNYMGLPEVKGEDHYDTFLYRAGKGMVEGDLEEGMVGVGQSIGLVNNIMSIEEVIEWMMEGCEKVLNATAKLIT